MVAAPHPLQDEARRLAILAGDPDVVDLTNVPLSLTAQQANQAWASLQLARAHLQERDAVSALFALQTLRERSRAWPRPLQAYVGRAVISLAMEATALSRELAQEVA